MKCAIIDNKLYIHDLHLAVRTPIFPSYINDNESHAKKNIAFSTCLCFFPWPAIHASRADEIAAANGNMLWSGLDRFT